MSEKQLKGTGKKWWDSLLLWLPILLVVITILVFWYFQIKKYYICSVLLILYAMIPFFVKIEKKNMQAREIVTLAVLCAIAVISRAAFMAVPGFKPLVGIVMLAGMAFGAESGFLVGAMSAFVSNFIFGQGPWTPWQMFAYGVAGFLAGLLTKKGIMRKDTPLMNAIIGAILILVIVGPLLDTCSVFTVMTTYTASSVGAVYLAGMPLNITHALATALTLVILSKPLLQMLDRIKLKYGML